MAYPNEQQGNRKSVVWQGPIQPTWGERWRLLGLIAAFTFLGLGTAKLQAAPFAYITNSGSNTVSIIDTTTNTVVATVAVGSLPNGVACTLPAPSSM